MTGQAGETGWRRFVVYWGPVVGYAGLIFYLSAQSHPDDNLPSLFVAVNDKVRHALEYAGLGGLCYRAFRWGATGAVAARALLFSILTASLYGATDEVHQLFVPLRESSWQDWLADVTGSVLGAVWCSRISRPYFFLSAKG
ncbi:MAG: VanZ family protein [Nitrospira sp.]|nr:VanZ family protein [Nitrospira sp.]